MLKNATFSIASVAGLVAAFSLFQPASVANAGKFLTCEKARAMAMVSGYEKGYRVIRSRCWGRSPRHIATFLVRRNGNGQLGIVRIDRFTYQVSPILAYRDQRGSLTP